MKIFFWFFVTIVFFSWEYDLPDYFGQYSDSLWTVVSLCMIIGVISIATMFYKELNSEHPSNSLKKIGGLEWIIIIVSGIWLFFKAIMDLLY